ncbi:MAG: hypothetical protein AB4372_01520 [Xenococcus sp. (in: cyanobacteria)]
MIDLQELGTSAFDYFPSDILEDILTTPELKAAYQTHRETLHTDNLWDISKIKVGMKVEDLETGNRGKITNYHTTEVGELNGGVEVIFPDNSRQYYYPNQLKLVLT